MTSTAMSPNQRELIGAQSTISGKFEYLKSTAGALLVSASFSPSGTQDVNLTQVGGASVALGQALMAASLPVTIASNQSALTISGTVTANIGTTNGLALNATLTDKSQFAKLTDGTDTALITATGELNVLATAQPGVDIGDVTINNGSGASAVNIQDGGNVITVDGTVAVTQSTSPWIVAGGGTAGSAASGVVTVQGVASMTPVQVGDNSSSLSVDWNGTQPVTGSGTATGALRVELPTNGTGVIATVGAVTAITNALPAGTNAIGKLAANSGIDIGDVDVTSIVPGTGATNLGKAIDTATGATDTGVLALGTRDDDLATLTPVDGDNVQFRTDSEGAMWVTLKPQPTEGLSTMNASSSDGATALTNSAQAIKASAGCLYGYYIYNPNATAQFVQFYNTAAASVTVGTTNPLFMLTIPATSAANLTFSNPVIFTNAGFSWAATSTAGGNGAPSSALDAIAWYK